jgi:hypothetical protein
MGRLLGFMADNAVDLMFNVAAFLIVYLIARLLRANMLVALSIAVLPLLIAFMFQHRSGSTSLLALWR